MALTLEIEKQQSGVHGAGSTNEEEEDDDDEEDEGEEEEENENMSKHSVHSSKKAVGNLTVGSDHLKLCQPGLQTNVTPSRLSNVKNVQREVKVANTRTPSRAQKPKMPTTRSCGVQTPDTPGIRFEDYSI